MAEVLGRKRKMETPMQSVGGDNSDVDTKLKKTTKVHRVCHKHFPNGHVSTVFLGDIIPKQRHGCSSSGDMAQTSSTHTYFEPFQFACQLGDQWKERYSSTQGHVKGRCKVKVSTGDYDSDIAMNRMKEEFNFIARETLSKGKYASIILSSSTVHCKDIAMKFIKDRSRSHTIKLASCCSSVQEDPGEIAYLQRLQHPNLVHMIQSMFINGCHVLLLEFCENGNLNSLLNSVPNGLLSEHVSRKYFVDIVNGLDYLHSQSIGHCAISCDHVLLDKHNRARICGFGSAVRHSIESPIMTSLPQLTPYQAPEAILKQASYNPKKLDVWASGILLYKMVTGHYLFGNNIKKIPMQALIGPQIDKDTYLFSDAFHQAMKAVVIFDPELRPSILHVKELSWLRNQEKKVVIGYQYLVRRPERGLQSTMEQKMKEEHGI